MLQNGSEKMTQTQTRNRLSIVLVLIVLLVIAACSPQVIVVTATPESTLLPTFTPSDIPTFTPTLAPTSNVPTATPGPPTQTPIPSPTTEIATIEPLTGEQIPPPLTISLPAGWEYGYDTMAVYDFETYRLLPVAVYRGPITGGEGYIILFWGFPSYFYGNPYLDEELEPDLWVDGLRLLNLVVIEPTCTRGTDIIHNYTVGGLPAVGTTFSATDCGDEVYVDPDEFVAPDTHGWFAGLQVDGLNFVFYMFGYPIEAMNAGTPFVEMQAILDTVQFRVDEFLLTPAASP